VFVCGDHKFEAYQHALLAPRRDQHGKEWFGIAVNIYLDLVAKYGETLAF
jgi:hypothetical protein